MNEDKSSGPMEHACVGAAVGVAGAANTVALIGLTAGTLAALPIAVVAGAAGGLAWWVIKTIRDA